MAPRKIPREADEVKELEAGMGRVVDAFREARAALEILPADNPTAANMVADIRAVVGELYLRSERIRQHLATTGPNERLEQLQLVCNSALRELVDAGYGKIRVQ